MRAGELLDVSIPNKSISFIIVTYGSSDHMGFGLTKYAQDNRGSFDDFQ